MTRANTHTRNLILSIGSFQVQFARGWAYLAGALVAVYWLWKKIGFRWARLLWHHPAAAVVLGALIIGQVISPVVPPLMVAAVMIGVYVWMTRNPESYRKHAVPRIHGFLWALRFRLVFAKKLAKCGLVNEKDTRPALLSAWQQGCTTRVLASWVDGNSMEDFHNRDDRIAPAFNAQDCKIRPVYKNDELQPRLVEFEFLRRNPFKHPVGAEYIDFYLDPVNDPLPIEGNPTSMRRNGTPYGLPSGISELAVGEPGSGKSNYLRCRAYTNRHAIKRGKHEMWGIDGKKGVEISFLEKLFARRCYGDADDPKDFDGEAVATFLEEAVWVMLLRLWAMRQAGVVLHTATTDAPSLEVVVDELLVFDSSFIQPAVRRRIWAAIELIQRLGRAALVTIIGCAQDANMEDLPGRRGFPRRRVYRVKEKIQVDMAAGRGVWDRGGKSDRIPFKQKGTCYVEEDGGTTPEEIRDVMVTDEDIQRIIAEVGGQRTSVLWPIPVMAEPPQPHPQWSNPPDRPIVAIPERVATVTAPPPEPPQPAEPDPQPIAGDVPVGAASGPRSGPSFGGFGNR